MNDMVPLPGREFALIRELLAAAGRGEGSFWVVQGRAGPGSARRRCCNRLLSRRPREGYAVAASRRGRAPR